VYATAVQPLPGPELCVPAIADHGVSRRTEERLHLVGYGDGQLGPCTLAVSLLQSSWWLDQVFHRDHAVKLFLSTFPVATNFRIQVASSYSNLLLNFSQSWFYFYSFTGVTVCFYVYYCIYRMTKAIKVIDRKKPKAIKVLNSIQQHSFPALVYCIYIGCYLCVAFMAFSST
jgi:hypothetical protein